MLLTVVLQEHAPLDVDEVAIGHEAPGLIADDRVDLEGGHSEVFGVETQLRLRNRVGAFPAAFVRESERAYAAPTGPLRHRSTELLDRQDRSMPAHKGVCRDDELAFVHELGRLAPGDGRVRDRNGSESPQTRRGSFVPAHPDTTGTPERSRRCDIHLRAQPPGDPAADESHCRGMTDVLARAQFRQISGHQRAHVRHGRTRADAVEGRGQVG
ncbi:hypothetical protein ACI2K6_07435 [Microbacterium sp. NPDC006705]|uniref:hypothetical protein n=1 Tax=Microbacterium sp. NPDC006705 TaxID=3364181 RepID=UPI00384B1FA7